MRVEENERWRLRRRYIHFVPFSVSILADKSYSHSISMRPSPIPFRPNHQTFAWVPTTAICHAASSGELMVCWRDGTERTETQPSYDKFPHKPLWQGEFLVISHQSINRWMNWEEWKISRNNKFTQKFTINFKILINHNQVKSVF